MSKEKARRRAEERARKRAPKTRPAGGSKVARSKPTKKVVRRSAREQRRRRRIWLITGMWVVANALIWVFTDTWNARWFGLTITTILIPLIVWLVWDPEGRVDL
jgi:hypothetical protein